LKERDAALETLRGELHEKDALDELEKEEHERSHYRAKEEEVITKQLHQVKANVANLRRLIESRGSGAEYVERLRRAMDVAENEVYAAREAHRERLDLVCSAERVISRELMDLEQMIESWTSSGPALRPQSAKGESRRHRRTSEDSGGGDDGPNTAISRVETAFQPTELPPEVASLHHDDLSEHPAHCEKELGRVWCV
jgi:hypothetical protein